MTRYRFWTSGIALAALFLFLDQERALVGHCIRLARYHFATTAVDRINFYGSISYEYPVLAAQVSRLRDSDALPGDIYVFGSPVYYLLSGRLQAGNYSGYIFGFLLADQRAQLLRDLQRLKPPYVIVASGQPWLGMLQSRSPEILTYLTEHYERIADDSDASWYRIRRSQ